MFTVIKSQLFSGKNLAFVLLFSISAHTSFSQEKITVSKEEPIHVKESNAIWYAVVSDTLEFCVINAHSIAVINATFPKEKNVSRPVSFKVKNKKGEGRTINATVTGIANWNGKSYYMAELELGMNFSTHFVYRKVNCILTNLEDAEHLLYVGKNWLGDTMELK